MNDNETAPVAPAAQPMELSAFIDADTVAAATRGRSDRGQCDQIDFYV